MSESCPPIHGNRKDKDTMLRVSAQVESYYSEGVKEIAELTESSAFISANLFEFLHACLPNIVRGCKWILLYRYEKKKELILLFGYFEICLFCFFNF